MKVATWNVNSIRVRHARVFAWLKEHNPDILCLQELKTQKENFPFEDYQSIGYESAVYGQKTYNGVAILSKRPLQNIQCGFPADDDPQARFIAATVSNILIISAYFPNGQAVGSEKFLYKLSWIEKLHAYLEKEVKNKQSIALLGDFNIAPGDLDVYDPALFKEKLLCSSKERNALQRLSDLGLVDVVRKLHPEEKFFSWWDYRQLGFPKNRGLRIDHIFTTEDLAEKTKEAGIDRSARKGKQPSDHAPVWCILTGDL